MAHQEGRVLVVDDKEDVLTAIRLLLKEHVEAVHTTLRPGAVPDLLNEEQYDVVLLDMNFSQDASSGREGFEWLGRILSIEPEMVVVMITAYGDIDKAVRAMKEGAADFITKPWDNERLVTAVKNAVRLRRSRERAVPRRLPPDQQEELEAFDDEIIGRSAAMKEVFETIEKVAATDANVLILGENGTGKELVAQSLHRHSARADEPFVTADLGALSDSLFESELFGHVKGAFTGANESRPGRFEVAEGGTLFLDEIGNIPPPLQAKLLTVLQRREVVRVGSSEPKPIDIRLVSATNQPIYEMTRMGHFRQDLLYRINTVELTLPPLRERTDDIPLLAEHFRRHYVQQYGRSVQRISEEALEQMCSYAWPGNIRELKHTIERAVILCEGPIIDPQSLSFSVPPEEHRSEKREALELESLDLESIEQAAVRRALSKHGGNVSRAAQELGISRKALYRRIEKYGL